MSFLHYHNIANSLPCDLCGAEYFAAGYHESVQLIRHTYSFPYSAKAWILLLLIHSSQYPWPHMDIYLCQYFYDKKTIKSIGAHPHQILATICTCVWSQIHMTCNIKILMHGSPQFLKHFLIFCCYNQDPVHQACLIHIHLLHLPWTLILDQLFRQFVFIAMFLALLSFLIYQSLVYGSFRCQVIHPNSSDDALICH